MILIGQFDSPFVRRVGITMRLCGMDFEHRPWSVFGDADKIRAFNPLVRVPVLVRDDGLALVDSGAILDYAEGSVLPARRLTPAEEPLRSKVLRICALAAGLGDKAVALFYELRLHTAVSEFYVARCRAQIGDTLELLERECAAGPGPFLFGERMTQADITLACVLRHAHEAHPDFVDLSAHPALAALAARMEALPVFQEVSQPFIAPKA